MAKIVFHGDDEIVVDVRSGESVMEAAVREGVDGIVGECGGNLMCATCHVYVDSKLSHLPDISDEEDAMLDCAEAERRDCSRLSCQLVADDSYDGLVLRVPGV